MLVDSTALPQQAIKDILDSAFRSAGQRCSALRVVYLQNDIAPAFLDMLYGAMDELVVGDPWDPSTDIGPIINEGAQTEIVNYIEGASSEGRLLKRLSVPPAGTFVAPSVIKVGGIHDMHREIFGPVLHVATYKAHEIGRVVSDINGSGYGLTFGLHTRIDDRVEALTTCLNVGNIYVNRNQIGAVVGSQPFGGEGLSGTGPKAGGPNYVRRFAGLAPPPAIAPVQQEPLALAKVQAALDAMPPVPRESVGTLSLPGPTGESNRLSLYPRGVVLCLGPLPADAATQAAVARSNGCLPLTIHPGANSESTLSGYLNRDDLARLSGFDAVVLWSDEADLRAARKALAERNGPLIPLIADHDMADRCVIERHVCIDTTASGGNASLMAGAAGRALGAPAMR